MTEPRASVVITTRNRCDDTLRAAASALAQSVPVEVLVFDDASEDETVEALCKALPEVRVFAQKERSGYIALRNRGFREARSEIVFSIDDDAYFTSEGTVESVLALFERTDDLFAVAIPFWEPLQRQSQSSRKFQGEVHSPGDQVRSYIGCAHAVRKRMVLDAGCYREFFEHQGEERDLCIRALDQGYRILYADCAPIVHMVSPRRDSDRQLYFGVRNTLLFDMLNAPFPDVVIRSVFDSAQLLRYRFSLRTLPIKVRALVSAVDVFRKHAELRAPVAGNTWRTWRRLRTHGSLASADNEAVPEPAGGAPGTGRVS